MTEYILTEFSRKAKDNVWIHKAKIGEEVRFGLDWACAFRIGSGWLVALVQAKQLDGKRFGVYPELRAQRADQQSINLIHAAAMADALPLYVFYNSEVMPFGPENQSVRVEGCNKLQLNRRARQDDAGQLPWDSGASPLGVTLAHASDIRDHVLPPPHTHQRAQHVNHYVLPWECLFCPSWEPPSLTSKDGPAPQIAVVAQILAETQAGARDEPDRELRQTIHPPWFQSARPEWATLVVEGEDPTNDPNSPSAQFYVVADLEIHD